MNAGNRTVIAIVAIVFGVCRADSDQPSSDVTQNRQALGLANTTEGSRETELRADKRYNEMLNKMQAAVEEIAQLYGNPMFLQVFTNDADQAVELKERLRIARGLHDIRHEMEELGRNRDELLSDIALKQQETAKLSARLLKQRKALDALAAAFDLAKDAVENTAR